MLTDQEQEVTPVAQKTGDELLQEVPKISGSELHVVDHPHQLSVPQCPRDEVRDFPSDRLSGKLGVVSQLWRAQGGQGVSEPEC